MKKLIFQKVINLAPLFFIGFFLFLFPLIFAFFIPTYNVFELVKASYLWPASLFLLFLTLLKLFFLKNKKLVIYKKYLFVPFLLLFILLIFNSVFLASDQSSAIFGDYNRRFGLISQLALLLWFFLMTYNLFLLDNFKQKLKYILGSIVISSLILSLYGFFQYIGLANNNWTEAVMANRIISTLGQPNFLASFLLLSLGASFAFIVLKAKFYWRLLTIISIFFQFLALFLTFSRSAYLALFIILFFFLFLYLRKQKRFRLIIVVSAFLFLLLFSFGLSLDNRQTELNLSTGSLAARLQFYPSAWQAIKDRPFFGYGIEQGGSALIKYYQKDWALFGQVNDYPDRAHNLFLDLLINFGFLGLFIYILLFFSLAFFILFCLKDKVYYKYFLFLLLGLLAYFISLLFNFSSLASSLYAWSFIAIFLAYFLRESNKEIELTIIFRRKKIIFFLLITLFLFFISIYNSRNTIIADRLFFKGQAGLASNNLASLDYCWQAVDKSSDLAQKNFYQSFIFSYIADNYYLFPRDLQEDFKDYLEKEYGNIWKVNYNSAFNQAKISCILKKSDYLNQFNDIIKLSPNRPAVYRSLGNCNFSLNNWSKAIDNYNQALELLPNINDSRLNKEHLEQIKFYRYLLFFSLAQSYLASDNYQLAFNYYLKAYNSYSLDSNLWQKILDTHKLINN
jgi:O-antigen ligase